MSQHLDALQRANHIRLRGVRVKAEIADLPTAAGARRVAAYLRDPGDASAMRLDALLLSIHRFGQARMVRLLAVARITGFAGTRRVREFTPRQRAFVACLLDELAITTDRTRRAT